MIKSLTEWFSVFLYIFSIFKNKIDSVCLHQDRIVSMTLDKEYDVAVQAIKLLTLVLQYV